MSDTTAALANFSRQIPEPAMTTGCPAQVIQSLCTLTLKCIFYASQQYFHFLNFMED